MRKKSIIIIILCVVVLSLLALVVTLTVKTRTAKPQLIGGEQDEHGCLIPAGYSWCKLKQKCLRVWEEPCLQDKPTTLPITGTPSTETLELTDDKTAWQTYTNTSLNFSLQFPTSWQDYKVTEAKVSATNLYPLVSFSFGKPHQPFEIFKIISYSTDQWANIPHNLFTVLNQTDTGVLVCDGCCKSTGPFDGGGQFDAFQVERCKETPQILSTFKTLK